MNRRYITVKDLMEKFNPELFVEISSVIGSIHAMIAAVEQVGTTLKGGIEEAELPDDTFRKQFKKVIQICRKAGLNCSAQNSTRLMELVSQPTVDLRQLRYQSESLLNLIEDEMIFPIFYEIEPDEKHLVIDRYLFGEEVARAFPSTVVDIEEAGKCLAFERTTACVFHLMRVMEMALRILGLTLNLPTGNPTWEMILAKCDKEQAKPSSQRTPEWQNNDEFLAGATAMLRSVKNAWRNPTMHIDKVYTKEQAQDIWDSVRGFMRHLATQLKE